MPGIGTKKNIRLFSVEYSVLVDFAYRAVTRMKIFGNMFRLSNMDVFRKEAVQAL